MCADYSIQCSSILLVNVYVIHSLSDDIGWTNCTSHLINKLPHRYLGSSTGERS